ncbi:MAG: DUF4382 domain-containing protein [Aquificaceae bacterium]
MKKQKAMYLALLPLLGSLLGGCGGGGSTADGSTNTVSLSLFFTDSPADAYSSVLVKVYEVNLCSDNQCQSKVTIFSNSQGLEVDLSKLRGLLQYINTSNIQNQTYNRLEVVMDKNMSITDASGNDHPAIFTPMQEKPNKPNTVQCDNTRCYIRFNGTVQPSSTGRLVVDFVLKDFDVDESTNPWQVREVKMMPLKPQSYPQGYWKIYITAQGVQNSAITGTWINRTYTINVDQNTLCEVKGAYHLGTACLNHIQSGMCIEVKTDSDPANSTSLGAIKIETERSYKCMTQMGGPNYGSPKPYIKVKGNVTAIGSNTFNINTYPNPIEITANTVCEYQKHVYITGSACLSQLQSGWYVEVKIANNQAIKIEREYK